MKICLSFAGVAGNYPFHIGCAKKLLEKYNNGENELVFAGTSSGCLIATFLALGHSPDDSMELLKDYFKLFDKWYKTPLTYWFVAFYEFFNMLLVPDDYKKCNDRLFIGYSVLTSTGIKSRIVHNFSSNTDLLSALCASSRLFPYQKYPLYPYKNELSFDGVFTKSIIKPIGYKTIYITSSMCYSNTKFADFFPTTDYNHVFKLYKKGQDFIEDNKDYFENIVHGEEITELELKPHVNPANRIIMVLKLLTIISVIIYYRKYIFYLFNKVRKLTIKK